jgi:hypothetical protein
MADAAIVAKKPLNLSVVGEEGKPRPVLAA